MPPVLASEDKPTASAPGKSGERGGAEPDETFIDLDDQRIRVVRARLSLSPHAAN